MSTVVKIQKKGVEAGRNRNIFQEDREKHLEKFAVSFIQRPRFNLKKNLRV